MAATAPPVALNMYEWSDKLQGLGLQGLLMQLSADRGLRERQLNK